MRRLLGPIGKVLTFQMPPRLLVYAARNKINRWLKTGDRRFEFERRYLECRDPWDYQSNPYEHRKYQSTLACALKWRSSDGRALEVGCSIGVFTKMMAGAFQAVTAIDLSKEILPAARQLNAESPHIEFRVADIRSADLGEAYDVIFCAEVLYYIAEVDAPQVRRRLDRFLATDGIIIMVTLQNKPEKGFFYFDEWDKALAPTFQVRARESFADPTRPYEITVLARPGEGVSSQAGRAPKGGPDSAE